MPWVQSSVLGWEIKHKVEFYWARWHSSPQDILCLTTDPTSHKEESEDQSPRLSFTLSMCLVACHVHPHAQEHTILYVHQQFKNEKSEVSRTLLQMILSWKKRKEKHQTTNSFGNYCEAGRPLSGLVQTQSCTVRLEWLANESQVFWLPLPSVGKTDACLNTWDFYVCLGIEFWVLMLSRQAL